MALDSPKLQDVLKDIAAGALQLPDFQRDWKWDDQRIRELIATVTLDYPLGVVMTLETGGHSPFRARPLTGTQPDTRRQPGLLLLDGQQRLTSLFQALHLDNPVQTIDARGKELRRWYYIDIAKAVGSSSDRDEAIVSVPEDKTLRSDFARKVVLDLSTTEKECRAAYFPLYLVFDVKRVNAWHKAFVSADDANWDLWAQFEQMVLNNVQSFQIPMIKLAANTTKDAVCSVFERVNTNGVPLNVFELLTATYAGDRSYEDERGDYFRLPDEWQDIKKRLAASYPVFGNLEQGLEDGFTSSDFLQAISLVSTWERKQDRPSAAVSCKRRDLLALPLTEFQRLAPRVTESLEWVGEFLHSQCIVRSADLPYRTQVVPLAAIRAILGDRIDDDEIRNRVARWYWCGVVGEMYGGSTESRFTRDVEQFVAWVGGGGDPPDTITEAVFVADRLDSLTTRNSAAYKGVYALLIKQGAVDWFHTDAPLDPGKLLEHFVDIRHIFPRTWLSRQRPGDARVNSVVNKTPLSYRAHQTMSGSPASYILTLAAESGMRAEWFDDVVATHLIDPDSLRGADFDRFYADRSRQLLDLVNSAMGKRTVFRDGADR